jgi:hypothetical protein
MTRSGVIALLLVSVSGLVAAAGLPSSENTGLEVHEWGTFTSVAGEDGSAVDWNVLGGKDDLPGFVNDRGFRQFKFRLAGTVRMETPVVYFYSGRELNVHVKVSFPKGLITEWYPKAKYQVDQKIGSEGRTYRLPANLGGIDTSMMSLIGGIEWRRIDIEPEATPNLPLEGTPSRYYAARATDASPIAVDGQHEKFLFYRGVGRFAVPLSARVDEDGTVVLDNHGAEVPLAILFENRGGKLGYSIVAGPVSRQVTLERPPLGSDFAPLAEQLENSLVEQGLFRKEAQAMIETWRDSWFEEGSRVIYIVPSATVDAVLPLQIDPAPSQITRVFVGRIELVTPETTKSVKAAITANDPCVFDRYGRFLEPILKHIVSEDPSSMPEIERWQQNAGEKPSACRGALGHIEVISKHGP